MTAEAFQAARKSASLTQVEAAANLGISQAYLSLLERGLRPIPAELQAAAVLTYALSPTELPIQRQGTFDRALFPEALGALGYSGFAYLAVGKTLKLWNPAQLLFEALDTDNLEPRVTEALPWLPLRFPEMAWPWLLSQAKAHDRQNRLGFVVSLAIDVAHTKRLAGVELILRATLADIDRSRLAEEGTLCREGMTPVRRDWLRTHRRPQAAHWNMLSTLKGEDLPHALL